MVITSVRVAARFRSHAGRALRYTGGVNRRALLALAAGIAAALAGLLHPALRFLFDGAWFSAAGVAGGLYWLLMKSERMPA
jgi:NCS1 family nucleobase:cation symporter-1